MTIVKITAVREKTVHETIRHCKGPIKNVRSKVRDEKRGKT